MSCEDREIMRRSLLSMQPCASSRPSLVCYICCEVHKQHLSSHKKSKCLDVCIIVTCSITKEPCSVWCFWPGVFDASDKATLRSVSRKSTSAIVWMGSSMRINESACLTGHIKQRTSSKESIRYPWLTIIGGYITLFSIRGFSPQNKTRSLPGLQKYHEHKTN